MSAAVRLAARAAGAVALVALGACTSPIVGAECRADLARCGAECVDLESDPRHCGACDRACAAGQACERGVCVGGPADGGGGDGGVLDGAVADAAAGEAGVGDAAAPDAAAPDAGDAPPGDGGAVGGCDVGELRCGDACVRPGSDPAHCGGCDRACAPGEVCAGGRCASGCAPPRAVCDDRCVDPRTDPDHCGACGVRCPSGICVGGACSGPRAGHLVVVGHDYRESRPDMNRVAGNAVFLGRGNPVRVLAYEGEARPAAVAGVDAAVRQVAEATGRGWTRAVADAPEAVPLRLAEADVFLLYAQSDSSDQLLATLGGEWARALSTFLERGGVVVAFDGMGANAGTHTVLRTAGLFDASRRDDVTGRVLEVTAPGDAVAWGLPLRYRGEASSVRFDVGDEGVVVRDARGPVVVHRAVVP